MMAAAWAYWLERYVLIERLSGHAARKHNLCTDELRQELVLRLVEVHHRFEPSRGSATNWAAWQLRAVVTKMNRTNLRNHSCELDSSLLGNDASQRRTFARLMLRQVFAHASEKDLDALTARVEGWSGAEIQQRLACAPFSVRRRIAKLAERVEDESNDSGGYRIRDRHS